uniref:Uncharacterized protein n=1 Tax=Rhizophora mucronata TaxID=61149 RepID=A0A2P2NEN8_RHIMU
MFIMWWYAINNYKIIIRRGSLDFKENT